MLTNRSQGLACDFALIFQSFDAISSGFRCDFAKNQPNHPRKFTRFSQNGIIHHRAQLSRTGFQPSITLAETIHKVSPHAQSRRFLHDAQARIFFLFMLACALLLHVIASCIAIVFSSQQEAPRTSLLAAFEGTAHYRHHPQATFLFRPHTAVPSSHPAAMPGQT